MSLTHQQAVARAQWIGWDEGIVKEVDISENFVSITLENGTGFGFAASYGVTPKPGDSARIYTESLSTIRGVDINNEPVFFWTDEDMQRRQEAFIAERDAEKERVWQRDKDKLLAAENELPDVFRQRINWFREHCPEDFNKSFLAYEILCCTEAVRIFEALKTPERIQKWIEGGYKRRLGLYISKEHSGNSLGMAARLAYNYAHDQRMVFFEHGALVPLVGCQAYGCAHPRPGIEEYAKEKGLELG